MLSLLDFCSDNFVKCCAHKTIFGVEVIDMRRFEARECKLFIGLLYPSAGSSVFVLFLSGSNIRVI